MSLYSSGIFCLEILTMNEKVVEHIQKLRAQMHNQHKDMHSVIETLTNLMLEEDLNCYINKILWNTLPTHKITLVLEITP